MNILAMDGSGSVAGIAAISDGVLTGEYLINYKKTHSQTLLPMMSEVLEMLEMKVEDIDYIAVTAGPGSFTGLRICASTAKGLGLAIDKPLVAVPTIEAMCYNYEGTDKLVCPIMDARRNQVYYGIYKFDNTAVDEESGDRISALENVEPVAADDIVNVVNKLNELGKEVIFLGDGVKPYKNIIKEYIKLPCVFAPSHLQLQKPGSLARAAEMMVKQGRTVSAMEFVPDYYRMSQAERERNERLAAQELKS